MTTTPATFCRLAGYYINDGAWCALCPWGYWCAGDGQRRACAAGTAAANPGASAPHLCLACAAGTYAPSAGAAACAPCPIGFYCPLAGLAYANACPPHTSTLVAGAAGLEACVCNAGYACTYQRELTVRLALNTSLTLSELQNHTALIDALQARVLDALSTSNTNNNLFLMFRGFT